MIRFLYTIAAGFILLLVGCSSSQSSGNKEQKKLLVGIVFDSGGRGDKSFNDSAYAGVELAQKELGIEVKTVDSQSAKDYAANLEGMAEQGCQLIFAIGAEQSTALREIAPKYPDVKFAIVDDTVDAPNVRSLKFKEEEGSYLAGYLAGLFTKTGKIGFIGGMDNETIDKFLAGYKFGAQKANPKVQVLPPKYTGDWVNADLGKTAANVLFQNGADIVYAAAGRAGLGVLKAANENGKFAIGVDQDQDYLYPGTILTSMVKRVDQAVFSTIQDTVNGKFEPGLKVFNLESGGVGLSEMKFTKDKIGQDVLDKVESAKREVREGKVQVPTKD